MLDKLSGVWAPRATAGPHRLRECLPLVILLKNRLKYALTAREVRYIVRNRSIKIDHKVRTDTTYPTGFMDVITIDKTNENFRLLYDPKGRFYVQRVSRSEAKFKLCKVVKKYMAAGGIPYIATSDKRVFRFPDPLIKVNDSIKVDLDNRKITDIVPFEIGNLVMITGGSNIGRVGLVQSRERHPGSHDIIHIKDAAGHTFATRLENVFVIGRGSKSLVSLPKDKGVRRTILENREITLKHRGEL
jgi:small subunit ribosomal protein S4e